MFKIRELPDAHIEGVVWHLVTDDGEFAIIRYQSEEYRGHTLEISGEVERHPDLEWARGRLTTLAGHVL